MLTVLTPDSVESFAVDFIEAEVSKKLNHRIDNLQIPKSKGEIRLSKLAQNLILQNEEQIDEPLSQVSKCLYAFFYLATD